MTAKTTTSTVTQTINISLTSWLLASASSFSSSADPNATQRFVTEALLVANGVVQSLIRVQEDARRERCSRHGKFANFGSGGSSFEDATYGCIDAEEVKAENFVVKIVLRGPRQSHKLVSSSSPAAVATPSPSRTSDRRSTRQGNRTLDDNDDDGDNDDCTPLERLYRDIDPTFYSQPPKRALPVEGAIEPCMGFFSRWIPQNPSPDEVATAPAEAQTQIRQPPTAATGDVDVSTERREEEANVLRQLRELGPDRLGEGFAGVEYVGPVRDATTFDTNDDEPRWNRHRLHRLGRILYFLFSGGGPLPPSLSIDDEENHDDCLFGGWLEGALASIDASEDTAHSDGRDDPSLLRKGKQRRKAGHGKNDIDDDDTNVYRLLHGQKRIPRSICRLVYDLWKSDSQNDASIDPEEAFTSLEEVSTELLSMMAQPHIFLRDDEPQTSLTWDDTKLYGRAKEVERLLDAMAGASTNRQPLHRNHLVLVAGCSGSGKSSLVTSTVSAVTEMGWMVLESKFEDRSARHPLSVIMAAFEGYFASVWEEEEENAPYRQHVERSLQALIPLTEVPFLAKLVPSIARFFTGGHSHYNEDNNCNKNTYHNNNNYNSNSNCYYAGDSSPAHNDYDQRGSPDSDMGVSSSEHQMNRLCCLFQLIIHAMNSGGRPLLFFMDDLQYADPSAIELFESFLFNSQDFARNIQSLGSNAPVFVGTYRDNEVNDTNNLSSFLSTMRESSYCVRLTEIQLENLPLEAVNEMISETLRLPKRVTKTLAEVTVSKTDGSPLFLRSFLNSMVEEGNIRYSLAMRRWTWDTLALSESAVGDDVAALLARKLLRLPASVQMALRTASCFGMRVEEWMIKDPDMLACLDRAGDQGLVERFGSTITFVHSSVHSAAYNLLPENERKAAHMNLGLEIIFNQRNTAKVVRSKSSVVENLSNSMVITAIDQINRCRPLTISDPALLRIFSEMNLRAGNECFDMSDFLSAQKYFLAGKEFLRIDNWQSDYDLMLSLANGLCIASYVNGDSLTLLACAKEVVQHAQKSVQDKLVAYSMHIKLLVSQGCQAEAIDAVLRGLHELGETFPQSDSNMSDLDAAKDVFFSTKQVLENAGTEAFELCPQLVDKRKMWAMKLMVTAFKNIMQSNLAYTVLISCRMIAITLNYGSCDRSAFGLVAFAIASLSLTDDFEFSYRWGRAGIQLLQQQKKNGDHNFSTRVNNFFTMFLSAPADPFQATQDVLYSTYKTSMRKGDVDTAAEAATFYFHLGAMTGMKLSLLDSKFVEFSTTMSRKKQKHQLLILSIINSFVLALMGVGRNVHECTTGSTTSQDERLEDALKNKKLLVVRMIYFYNMQECFWNRNFENAYNFAEKHTCTKGPGLLKGIMVFFYKGLMAFYFARSKGDRKWIDEGLKSVSALKSWYKRYNWNYENKYFILLAEYYNSVGDVKNSMDYYAKAVQSARNHRFPHEEGLSLELFGYFHLRLGNVCRGKELIRESCIPYKRWGGITKVKLLESFLSSDISSILIY